MGDEVVNEDSAHRILRNVRVGQGAQIWNYVNAYDCVIGADTMIGTFVEIQGDVVIGARCRVQSHSFLCSGVTLEDDVFVGHGVMFVNDRLPSSSEEHRLDWTPEATLVRAGGVIGSNATVMGGLVIGAGAIVGAGAVVVADVAAGTTVVGVPAKPVVRP